MTPLGSPDVFIVLNGPQDGTEFPVADRQIHIGHGSECVINLQLDRNVHEFHATATATADGYRIRAHGTAPVTVNGKSAGQFKSRMLHTGDIMQVGYTEILLECSPDGIAQRSRGIALQNDFAWAFKHFSTRLLYLINRIGYTALQLPKLAWRHKIITIILLIIAARYIPSVAYFFDYLRWLFKSILANFLRR